MKSARRSGRTPSRRAAVLIIAGGRGTRFWPASRNRRPKPLFKLTGETSLIADTIGRHRPLIPLERIFVLVPRAQRAAFARELKDLIPPSNLLVEPEAKGTAVAIAYGAAMIRARLGETMLAVMPADHHVGPASAFRRTLSEALRLAHERDAVVVVGVTPRRPDSGYGYIEVGRRVGAGFRVEGFVEKPPPAAARRMVRAGGFLWNAGMFVMGTKRLAAELAEHCPKLAAAMETFAKARPSAAAALYKQLHFDSFDRVVIERSTRVLGVRARFQWHDVGSWEGLWEAQRGEASNVLHGNVLALETKGVLARSDGRLMVLLGVEDLVAVEAGDALLIARRSRSQEIRRVIDELERRMMHRYL